MVCGTHADNDGLRDPPTPDHDANSTLACPGGELFLSGGAPFYANVENSCDSPAPTPQAIDDVPEMITCDSNTEAPYLLRLYDSFGVRIYLGGRSLTSFSKKTHHSFIYSFIHSFIHSFITFITFITFVS